MQSFTIKCLSFRWVSFVQGYRLCIEKLFTWIILSGIFFQNDNQSSQDVKNNFSFSLYKSSSDFYDGSLFYTYNVLQEV